MATITMSTNSASTSNNGGTGNKQLRGSLVTLQNDIDLADAILQNGGTALAANDIIEAIAVPANTLILFAGFKVVTAMEGTTTDSAIHVGITGTDVDVFVASFDLDGASVGAHTPPITSGGVCTQLPVYTASADTIDVEIETSGGTITGGIIRVYAVCVLLDDVTQSSSANEVDRDLLA
jgi:hypothetical protein